MLMAKCCTIWQATPNNRAIATVADDDEGRAPQPAVGDAIGTMAEPGTGEAHQLLTTNGNSRQHRWDLDVLNQQTIQQSQDQDAKNPQAELEQTQTQSQPDTTHRLNRADCE